MYVNYNDQYLHVEQQTNVYLGGKHTRIDVKPRTPACFGVYVGHPISGIRVSRILEMQETIRMALNEQSAVQKVKLYFPMRTTHLCSDEIGDNEYNSTALFASTRAFTLQNRLDALKNSDAVFINYNLCDDTGNYRISKGIPFDWGWASQAGKPVVAVIKKDNPNYTQGLVNSACAVISNLEEGIQWIKELLHYSGGSQNARAGVEIFEFTEQKEPALDLIAELARADARRYNGGGAIIVIMPGCKNKDKPASFHGQIAEVADWLVEDRITALSIAQALLDTPLA